MKTRWVLALAGLAMARGAVLPAGTELEIRLQTKVSSNASKAQEAVEAVLVRPVFAGDGIALAAGSIVNGAVKQAVAIARQGDRAALELAFTSVTPKSGKALKIETRLAVVDNARESVDQTGRITGILPSETIAAQIQSGVERVSKRYSQLGELLEGVRSAVLKEPEPEIVYGPGVEMTLVLSKPAECPVVSAPPAIQPVAAESDVFKLVNSQPFQTTTEAARVPSDLTNLMFLGTQAQLEAAFQAAGWATAAQLDTASGMETFRAIAEMRGYKEAPMSVLLLDGQKPSLVFQKQNNTFAMRHHLRIWRRPGAFEGRPVWVCAATHDIGIEFSAEQRNFIHKIDSQIDRERAKVTGDLLFTGKVKGLSLVARPAAPQHSRNATGDNLETDGKMAVLLLE